MMSIVVFLGNVQNRLMRFNRFTVLLAKGFFFQYISSTPHNCVSHTEEKLGHS